MRKSNKRLLSGLFIILVLGGLTPVRAAQFQNPIQAAKDAYNKAKQDAQQQKQQQQRQQPGQQQPQPNQATNTTSAQPSPAQSGSAAPGGDCCSPEALKKIAASVGFVDIVGIKLGMTPEQATAVIRAYKPTLKIEVLNTRLFHPGSDQFLRVPHYISAQEPSNSQKGYEYIILEFTQPPSPPLVSKIERHVAMPVGQPVMASSMLESLRKKYGQDNFSTSDARAWIYDLSGKLPVRLPKTAVYCATPSELALGTGDPQADYGELSVDTTARYIGEGNLNILDCVPYVAVVARPVGEGVAPNTQLIQLIVTLQSEALVYNSTKATYNWLKAEADAKAKEQADTAKSRTGPKL
jgi:hypothetical protein